VDTIAIRREAASPDANRVYLLLNKPKGVLCTVKDTHGRPTVVDLVPPHAGRRLYPVGRLDEDSEGLVLMTNDGELTARLTHPRYAVPKTYDVRVKGRLTEDQARQYEAGVWLSEGRTGRSRVRIRKSRTENTHVAITLYEGRNREIRRAFAKLGFPVLSVRRIAIGPIEGRALKVGEYRPLAADELEALRAVAEGREGATPRPRPRRGAPSDGQPRRRRRPGKPDPALAPREDTRRGRGGKPGDRRGGRGPSRGGPRGGGSRGGAPRGGSRPGQGGGPRGGKGGGPRGGRRGGPGGKPPGGAGGPGGRRPGGKPSGGAGGGRRGGKQSGPGDRRSRGR
jgi:23S rRNA pseudouridine2605 synthase